MNNATLNEHQSEKGSAAYKVAALARKLDLSEKSTRDAIRRGDIPHIKLGKRYILPRTAIDRWLQEAGRIVA